MRFINSNIITIILTTRPQTKKKKPLVLTSTCRHHREDDYKLICNFKARRRNIRINKLEININNVYRNNNSTTRVAGRLITRNNIKGNTGGY